MSATDPAPKLLPKPDPDPQAEVLAFLAAPDPFGHPVTHIQTHGAHVFLSTGLALKLKRAVRYTYMDMSTPARREALLRRELALNQPTAPGIYRDVIAVTRGPDGALQLGATGEVVDWVLRMNRFDSRCELSTIAEKGGLTPAMAEDLGVEIQHYHAGCPRRVHDPRIALGAILKELAAEFAPFASDLPPKAVERVLEPANRRLGDLVPLLRHRVSDGHVARGHGDLHLRNLLWINGHPVLFDALEFDEGLATSDVLYDLAFLLMDLCHRGLRPQANAAMNAYLLEAQGDEDGGLAALPLFLALRAAIRAMVHLQARTLSGGLEGLGEARRYLREARSFLRRRRPRLVVVGGLSGVGKSVLARAIAPRIGACPGAVLLRSDAERKVLGNEPNYAPDARMRVYDRLFARARTLLAAGHSVILDATFLDPALRQEAETLAGRFAVPFSGLWLEAPEALLLDRLARRSGDVSDADAAVLARQLAAGGGRQKPQAPWSVIPSNGTPAATRRLALLALGRAGRQNGVHRPLGEDIFHSNSSAVPSKAKTSA